MKKNIPLALIIVIIILIVSFFLLKPLSFMKKTSPSGKITAYFHIYSSPGKEVLSGMLEEFTSFYKDIDLEYHIKPYRDMKKSLDEYLTQENLEQDKNVSSDDTITVTVLTGSDLGSYPVVPHSARSWTGTKWSLFFSISRLDTLGYSKERLIALGDNGFENFVDELNPLKGKDETLFNLGANFYWPYLAWIQHLQLLSTRGKMPSGYLPSDWQKGIIFFDSLVSRGLINQDFKDKNWASSLYSIEEEKALFVLSDSTIYNAYHPDIRPDIDSLPFPGSGKQGWQIGSSFYLCLIADETVQKNTLAAGELLISYLKSEGIRNRFLQQTGTRLYGDSNSESLREIPSLTQKVQDNDIQELLKFLKP